MKELLKEITELQENIQKTQDVIGIAALREEALPLQVETEQPDFWADQEQATRISQRLAEIQKEIQTWDEIAREVNDLIAVVMLADQEGDVSIEDDSRAQYTELLRRFKELEFYILFSGDYDKSNAIVAIHGGSGGTEAQDWAEMLLRMILRFCEKKGFTTNVLSESRGSEAGIKSVMVEVRGRYAYGYLQSEYGVHRLVRISPFDADKARHTSFALVEVIPELDEVEEIVIDPKDLRVDTYAASGHGGQSVNTTNSAVRIVHLPTNITVTCQNERSQIQNRETAMKVLKSKLLQVQLEAKDEEKQKLRGEFKSAEWGNQIRSYVLQPYKMVKDHRTGYQDSDPERVLEGDLEALIESYLQWKRAARSES